MASQSILDIVPDLDENDIKLDVEGEEFVIDTDPETNPNAKEARMFTLE